MTYAWLLESLQQGLRPAGRSEDHERAIDEQTLMAKQAITTMVVVPKVLAVRMLD